MRSDTSYNAGGWKKKWKNRRGLWKAAAVILVIIAACAVFGLYGKNDTISIDQAEKSTAKTEASSAQKTRKEPVHVYIDVEGEVRKPGVYELKSGSRIFEAIQMAGGLTSRADTRTINQAEKVTDGQLIVVPKKGQGNTASNESNTGNSQSGSGSSAADGGSNSFTSPSAGSLININTADSEELQKIPGVGPVTAQKIIDYRTQNGNFRTKADLKQVSGIGEKTYAKMENLITV